MHRCSRAIQNRQAFMVEHDPKGTIVITGMNRAEIESLLPAATALVVVPPFCDVQMPSLAAHVLQACARREGFSVRVLYANILFSRVSTWRLQTTGPTAPLTFLGERLF